MVSRRCWVIALVGLLLPAAASLAGPRSAAAQADTPYYQAHPPAEGEACDCVEVDLNYIDASAVAQSFSDNEQSYEQYGYAPNGWYAGGRLDLGANCLTPARFELRLDGLTDETGRAWARWSSWPLTLEADVYKIGRYHWDGKGAAPALLATNMLSQDLKLRLHRGDFDNLTVRYQSRDYDYAVGNVDGFNWNRWSANYNWTWGGNVRGQFRQALQTSDAPGVDLKDTQRNTSQLKLDACLNDEFSAFSDVKYLCINADEFADSSIAAMDYKLGLRYRPDCRWEFDATYRGKDTPSDNTVTSHIDSFNEFGVEGRWVPGGGKHYEAGYAHRSYDYALVAFTEDTRNALRGASFTTATPALTAPVTYMISPEQDSFYFARSGHVFSKCFQDYYRLDYTLADEMDTNLVVPGSPSLFYNERLTQHNALTYDVNGRDSLTWTFHSQESSNRARGTDFDLIYNEASWGRGVGGCGYFTLAFRDTQANLDSDPTARYTTNDQTCVATYSDTFPKLDFALDLNYSAGNDAQQYTQVGGGADLKFKRWSPLGIRLDVFNRNYDTYPAMDVTALEIGLTYRIKF